MSKDYPLISVIIATFNSEKVLARCINSVLDQTYKNYELIIVDGASADNTVDIIKKFGTGISKWKSEKDNGIYEAWNKGVEMA
jgi:glycosyltransferase involved in cell wall biosynthesis